MVSNKNTRGNNPLFLFGVLCLEVKEFKGNPKVYVASHGGAIEVATDEHMRNANRPLETILREICQQAEEYAKKILPDYNYPNGKWYPCGSV